MLTTAMTIENICELAAKEKGKVASFNAETKNKMLLKIAEDLVRETDFILAENKKDVDAASNKPAYFIDRLKLNKDRILSMANGVKTLVSLPDPIGETMENWRAESGIEISKIRVPLGVIGIIYEARPNVTIDAVSLCLKTGNSVVLRGSKDAIYSNKALVAVLKASISSLGFSPEFIQLIPDVTREGAETLMKCRKFVDVLIPRGSADLIKTVCEKSSIPVIETGSGNCHAYVHNTADLSVATNIILNGKLQRPSVCNALESLVIDEEIAKTYLPIIYAELKKNGVEVVGCDKARKICAEILKASEEDFSTEFLALKISVKIVNGVDEAIEHINNCSTKHSEVIIAKDKNAIDLFLNKVDSACVYANASTRFTDGFEFGFGAEMGISTQKLHTRGPMGLRELTSLKYCIKGNGEIRK